MDFISKIEFQVGDKVKISHLDWKPFGFYGKSGEILKVIGRGWYTIHLNGDPEGQTYNFFVGSSWSDFEEA